MGKRGLTLVELIVVLTIIVMLMMVLLPALRMARTTSRNVMCMSNLRQWGIAAGVYMNRHADYLPKPQGQYGYGQTAIDDPYTGNWYNGLPVVIGAPRYTDIYDGTKTSQYDSANIWWCPQARSTYGPGGFTNAGNAFDYAFNTVIDGTDKYSNPGNNGQHHIRIDTIPAPTRTLLMTEPGSRFEYVSIGTIGVAADRHLGRLANMLFADGHVRGLPGREAQHVHSGPDSAIAPQWSTYWTTNDGEVVWGSFYR